MKKILVDPNMLVQTANIIDETNDEYRRMYNQLNSDVDALSSGWQGRDNIAFTNQIKGFNDDFNQVSVLLSQYSTFLKNAAKSYQQTQNELVNQVTRLAN